MGDDEAALVRLWREKRGEVEPEDLSGNLIVQLGAVTEDLSPALVRGQYRSGYRRHPTQSSAKARQGKEGCQLMRWRVRQLAASLLEPLFVSSDPFENGVGLFWLS